MSDLRPPGLISGQTDSGVRYSIWPDRRDTVAAVQTWVRTGTADEPRGRSGIAHMLEHMMFRGTERVPDGEFDALTEELGLYVNAATWLDYTFYTAVGPGDAMPRLIALEGDRFANISVAETAFVPERDVVANERRQVVDAVPESLLGERFHCALFDGTSYAWPTIGSAEDIAAYDAEAIRAFHRAHYTGDRVHVVVTGKVDVDEVEAAIRGAFAALPAHGQGERRRESNGLERQTTIPLALASPRVLIGWRTPARTDASWPAWTVLEELLAAAESSRLTQRLEYDDRLVLDIGSALYALREPSALELSLTLRRGVRPDDAIAALMDELALLAEEGPDEDELAGARARVRTSHASSMSETAGRAESLGESWAISGDPFLGLALPPAVARVGAADVADLAACLRDTEPVVYIGVPA